MGEIIKQANQFITLSDRNTVRADDIIRVYVDHGDYLVVQTSDGSIYQADVGYGQRVWQAKSLLMEQIEAALAVRNQG